MASDWSYTYAVARIRVLETRLLTNNDVSAMTALKSADAVVTFLKDKGWGDSSDGNEPERIFALEEQKTWALMKELGVDFSVFDVLSLPNIYHNLKAGVKEVCTSSSNEKAFFADDRFGRENMLKILSEKDWTALPAHMRKAAEEALENMLHTRDGQLSDVIVDRACLDAIEAAGRASRDDVIRDYAGSQVAVTDIKIAVRAAKTRKSLDFLLRALAPCSSFDVKALAQAAFQGEDSLLDFLSSSGFREAAEALKVSPSVFERWCDNRMIETIRPQKYETASVGPLVAYLLARENEIKTARIIITGKINGLTDEAIRERTREMYV
ncbi:MAG: V-type ATPase subunit [Lachnospiraceae bacterium]|nr:V-type ATPase subunit [Lachnospiraceae bacterium]